MKYCTPKGPYRDPKTMLARHHSITTAVLETLFQNRSSAEPLGLAFAPGFQQSAGHEAGGGIGLVLRWHSG